MRPAQKCVCGHIIKRDTLLNPNVVENLLTQSGLNQQNLTQLLDLILDYKIDFADLYFQLSQHESWVLEDGIIKDGSYNIERGVGVRAITGEQTGFAYSDEISLAALQDACKASRSIAKQGGKVSVKGFTSAQNKALYTCSNPLLNMTDTDKVDLLKRVDIYARKKAPEASQVSVSLTGVYEEILIAATDGTYATDIRPLIRLNCSVLLEKDGKRERGSSGAGGRRTYDFFEQTLESGQLRYEQIADQAIHMARINLDAIAAPA
ncbi:MAG: TldD protein, partial [Glaciecola sp.]